ncbi:MAG: hypothetical protein ABW298_13255, partial [Candidatus Binatia bacterium]
DEVLEKLAFIRDFIGANGFMIGASYAGMPQAEAERNLRCFAEYVLPQVKSWQTEPLAELREITIAQPVAASA